ncbi:carbohydrate ABC transporter permease [Paenibacillus macquariensis]|uniref:Aldouronate transport system permease protein n=1 Tax=Paenibacillus macquariensis TaxID=948756 RepID=A0ABY1KB56_9BACL|nr:carbohydrate ABC transporter permease [Paenibacillus macquariensis]MEC0089530.1 carbohydrate ABC transporter permease [Paenibacillus macquariensis]SIR53320.1 putative aldouronate transport system permease protein [Paenibacillus macquariensis]
MMNRLSLSNFFVNLIFIVYSVICVVPLLILLSVSFTNEQSVFQSGYSLIPQDFSLDAYKYILMGNSPIIRAYGITIFVTLVGTLFHLVISSMFAYSLSRPEVKYRNIVSFLVIFCLLFSGGLVPWYILLSKVLHLKDTIFVLIVPYLVSSVNVMILRNFFRTIPESIIESARIDGSGEFNTFLKLVIPLSTPVLATVGLFVAVFYWNDWFTAALLIENSKLYTLQFLLQSIMNNIAFLQGNSLTVKAAAMQPDETARMATCVLAVGPIVITYPFLQKYFVKGLTLGAVKA